MKEQVVKQKSSSVWGAFVSKLLNEKGIQKPRKGNDCGDHPPITPMRVASESELGGDTWRIYSYIVRHFIATVINFRLRIHQFSMPKSERPKRTILVPNCWLKRWYFGIF